MPLTLAAGFTADPDVGAAQYEFVEAGVQLHGGITGTFDGSGQIVGTLKDSAGIMPTYRPRATQRFPVAAADSGDPVPGYVEVGPAGHVTVLATGDHVSLDGVVFTLGYR